MTTPPISGEIGFDRKHPLQEEINYDYAAPALAKPSGKDIKTTRTLIKLTQQAAAEVVHRKDSARWREWESGRHDIDMAVWELFLIKTKLRQVTK